MVITTLHSPDTNSIFKNIVDAYPLDERESILDELSQQFRCFVSQRLVPKTDKK